MYYERHHVWAQLLLLLCIHLSVHVNVGLKKDALLLQLQVADAQINFGLAQAIGYLYPRMPFCIVDRAPKATHLPA